MLGGLARWLRAGGYEAAWTRDIDDWDLIRQAQREGRFLLSCDTGIFETGTVRDGHVRALLLPTGLRKQGQLEFVFRALRLPRREPRCMDCGGTLAAVARELAEHRAPPRTFAWVERFFECRECRRLYWEGSHWRRIDGVLARAAGG